MMNKTWAITMVGKTAKYEQDYNVPNGKVAPEGSTMAYDLDVFLAGLEKARAAGAEIVEGTRDPVEVRNI